MTCILQLTDLHLVSDPAGELKGVRTRDVVQRVLRHLREGVDAGRWSFDHIVITGDLAHDEQQETYLILSEMLGDWLPRCVVVPGNHDDRKCIRDVFPAMNSANEEFVTFSLEADGWRLIGLDSHVPGQVPGQVSEPQLEWLQQQLTEHATEPTLVFVHHPPFPIDSAWVDKIGLVNADDVWLAIRSCSQVRAVCAGHVHQQFESVSNGVRLLTTPSSALQFKPGADEFAMDDAAAGFRIFYLEENELRTEVVRVPEP